MRTSTRPAERYDEGFGRVREEVYVCSLGVGRLVLAGDLPVELELPDRSTEAPRGHRAGGRWAPRLERYFSGAPVAFDLDVEAYAAAHGFTDFERDVYRALAHVPYGHVVSYRDLAREAGRPNAYRAVGSAMARNELPVILPCHRVIKNDGRLGFYGDDPAWKERLLALEGVRVVEGRVV
jgi:methylated-DNA-[protein]-cysteine S-methyltransferase